jgi:hypothetical protein
MIVLKNGGRIMAESYREEGETVKLQGRAGEIGIPRSQIQRIVKAGESARDESNVPSLSQPPLEQQPAAAQPPAPDESPAPEEARDEERALQEKEFQNRLREVTQELEQARQRYFEATQGGGVSANVTKEGLRAWTADLTSRIKDSQKAPPSEYTAKERELSALRARIDALQKERQRLLDEGMRQGFKPAPD